ECYACRLDETTIGVIEPTPVQKEFLTMFFMESGANVLPAEAGDMLRTLLAKMLPAAATSEKC
ncbi:MAG: hypothetical protein ACI4SV_05010, partial [Duodenibacillus sp.]